MTSFKVLLLLGLITISSPSVGATADSKLEQNIKAILKNAHTQKNFSGSVAIQSDTGNIFVSSIGFQNKDITLKPEHVFSSGSVGKEFTTVAILRLYEENKLSLDTSIAKYISGLPAWGKDVSIRHILNHSSGLPKIQWVKRITTGHVMEQIKSIPTLAFTPGSSYLYSNLNVLLRAKVIKGVTGKSFNNYLQKHFLTPLSMGKTTLVTDIANYVTNRVSGDHDAEIDGVTIYTTPHDLLRWENALFSGQALGGTPINKYLSLHPLSGIANHAEFDFGRFSIDPTKEQQWVKHDGSNPSHHVLKYTSLSHNFSFVAMSSDGNKSTLYDLLNEVFLLITNIK